MTLLILCDVRLTVVGSSKCSLLMATTRIDFWWMANQYWIRAARASPATNETIKFHSLPSVEIHILHKQKVPSAARFPLPLMGFALIVFIGQLIQRHLQGYRWQSPPIAATRLG